MMQTHRFSAAVIGVMILVGCGENENRNISSADTVTVPVVVETARSHDATNRSETSAALRVSSIRKTAHVDDVMKNPDNYPGAITIVGVVARTDSERQMVSLIDAAEFDACREVGCAELLLPVRWRGTMPESARRVTASGRIVRLDGGLIFDATELALDTR